MKQKEKLNEKLRLSKKYPQWKKLKVSGDISALAEVTGKSKVTISKAVNKGEGSLDVLQRVEKYFRDRQEVGQNFNHRKNYIP